ncbi:MAG: class II fumarate hydratase [Candidatus Riflebacteria bacterium]|nr:class II fumarate hydratase [Candidatus Riflebacteria bacterium]
MKYRTEKDTLGEVRVPFDAYYGAQTQRAVENFPVSRLRLQPTFIRAQAIIKLAAAKANIASGRLNKKIGKAIIVAAEEILTGRFSDQFVVDVFQAGAGTSQNMNMNEVLANRAIEILQGIRGDYRLVHPNDHPNMSQSTNDTIHVAIHIAGYTEITGCLLPAVEKLESALRKKSYEFEAIVKTGRTHLQDAVPVRLGQEFGAYSTMIGHAYDRIEEATDRLRELCIGGTAVGTGLNTDPDFRSRILRQINKITGYQFFAAVDMFEAMQSFDPVLAVCGAIRTLVTSLRKIADDLRLLTSGPRTGLGEIHLPAVQPGSSIMPGKVNPVLPEMIDMICFHSLGCDATILAAAQAGQLELNVMMPVITYNFLLEIEILSNGIRAFTEKCITGIKANEKVCLRFSELSPSIATALVDHIGYQHAAELAKEALDKDVTIRELAEAKKILDSETLSKLLDVRRMTEDPAYPKKQ